MRVLPVSKAILSVKTFNEDLLLVESTKLLFLARNVRMRRRIFKFRNFPFLKQFNNRSRFHFQVLKAHVFA